MACCHAVRSRTLSNVIRSVCAGPQVAVDVMALGSWELLSVCSLCAWHGLGDSWEEYAMPLACAQSALSLRRKRCRNVHQRIRLVPCKYRIRTSDHANT